MDRIQLHDPNLLNQIDMEEIPQHVGIIMDGNGRWAAERSMPRMMGHRAGMEQLRSAVRFSDHIGIDVLSVYAFSSENWNRPEEEVKGLMRLLLEYMKKELEELDREGVQIRFMGDIEQLPLQVQEALFAARDATATNQGLIFNIGINYGGQQEIIRACRKLAMDVEDGLLDADQIDQGVFEDTLFTAGLPPMDLLIRTSGEERLSNFMLYQAAYSELVFRDAFWPDFDADEYCKSLIIYQRRSRRFGGI